MFFAVLLFLCFFLVVERFHEARGGVRHDAADPCAVKFDRQQHIAAHRLHCGHAADAERLMRNARADAVKDRLRGRGA